MAEDEAFRPKSKVGRALQRVALNEELPVHCGLSLQVTFQTPSKGVAVGSERWDEVRDMDEKQSWEDRSSVVTREEHVAYQQLARVRQTHMLSDLIECVNTQGTTSLNGQANKPLKLRNGKVQFSEVLSTTILNKQSFAPRLGQRASAR